MESQISLSLPSPVETPYRTPSSSLSHRSRDYEDMSPSSTPPPLPTDVRVVKKRSNDSQRALDEGISPLDPRRFTPTLHANLVSEILSLRRELETKTKNIDQLEQSLDTVQSQNEGLSKNLLTSNKEIRSVKRQMQLLEGGTLSALNDLSKERDEAIYESSDLRRRVEQFQKRARSHEDNADRTHAQWEKDKESWVAEKRMLETKAHAAESRLQAVLEEVSQAQIVAQAQAQAQAKSPVTQKPEIPPRSESRASIPGSPTSLASPELRHRRLSAASTSSDHIGGRVSSMSFANGPATNLADELALDDIEEGSDDETNPEQGRFSPDALDEERTRPTSSLSIKARKILGLAFDIEKMENEEKSNSGSDVTMESALTKASSMPSYVDSAIQYSPPMSPVHGSISGVYPNLEDSPSNLESISEPRNADPDTPVMVSASCQTVENVPSPPLTPKQDDIGLATIPESAFERSETKDMSTQTDVRPRPGASRYIHSRTSTHDLGIPVIAIIPPTSRPTTPETHVVLPPQTKNASCQVETAVLFNYTSSSMQTEEIRIDRRNVLSSQPSSGLLSSTQSNSLTTKGKSSTYSRRVNSHHAQSISNISTKRSTLRDTPVAPVNDNGPLSADSSLASSRPVRSSSLFAGFDDNTEKLDDEMDDDIFYEDEFASRPTAKFTLRSGKLVSQENGLEDAGKSVAVSAGEAVARDILRKSESTLPVELRQFDSLDSAKSLKHSSTAKRAPLASKQPNVRRSALISSGVAAHQSKHSQSTIESGSVEGAMPPPIPIPLRYSSARIGKSHSESGRNSRGSSNNASPTRQHRHKYKPALRKARSGPAISPASQTRRPRSKSPPFDSRVSIVPEMPVFHMPGQTPFDVVPPLTNDFMSSSYEASAPRHTIAAAPSRTQNHQKQASDPALLPQTSVVDAIAQTMVGEWMYKYVRRRKSFGKPDKDWDPNKSVEELTSNQTSAGVRHKRWVWLAPYERAVMWSSKQPMNGTALLGKGGRKLTVKSVLDVKDDNPMPKNSLTGPVFHRSILVLTPQRALKFTATSQERHFVWLTALSFLSHSPLSFDHLAALPPPPDEYRSPSPPPLPVGGSFRRRTLRDSIRIAKGSGRPQGGQRSVAEGSTPNEQYSSTRPSTREYYDNDNDIALPPTIKRFHTRNRSNTAPRPPHSSFMSFSQRDIGATSSLNEPGSFERTQYTPTVGNPSIVTSRRGSEASAFGRPAFNNNNYTGFTQPGGFGFSDSSHNASMTMRMDAFIDNKQSGKGGFRNLRLGGPSRSTNKDLGFWGIEEAASPVSTADSLTPATASFRFSDSAGGASTERDFFRGF